MSYPGSKSGAGVYQKIVNLMPPHDMYIEPFLGGGAVLRLKRPARLNIGIDLDRTVIDEWPAAAIAGFDDGAADIALNDDGRGYYQFKQGDGIQFLQTYPFTGRELIYCDPPYMHETRSRTDYYRHEMTDAQHQTLLETLTTLPCMVMLSGYWTARYAEALNSWNSIQFETTTRSGSIATEWLWFNFPEPVALHDYRYLGVNFRERERIKRKKDRWVNRLQTMPTLERQALLAAMQEAQF